MKITLKTLWIAVHHIFDEHTVGVGQCLGLQALMDAWRDRGLRQADLAMALESLADGGHLRLELLDTGPAARLLDNGFTVAEAASRDGPALNRLEQLRSDRQVTGDSPLSLIGASGRRAGDRAGVMSIAA